MDIGRPLRNGCTYSSRKFPTKVYVIPQVVNNMVCGAGVGVERVENIE